LAPPGCFLKLGFDVWHVPGVSRAWRYNFTDGGYVLVTDPGGYDLPEFGGPCVALLLTEADDVIEGPAWCSGTRQLIYWFRRACRRRAKSG
jgi:hypothetical protein